MDTGDTLEARQKRSRVKVAAGLPRQALTSLTSDGLAPHGPATFAKLKGKHPTAPLPSVHGDMKNPSGPADFTTKEVMAAITSMPRATTGGPSNLTDSLLRTLCVVQPKAHPWHACCPGEGAVITGKRRGSSIDRNFLRCAKLALMKVS